MLLSLLSLWNGVGAQPEVCGHLITEAGDRIVTETGDSIVTECFTPDAIGLRPGRVYKGEYPYFKPRRKPYWEIDPDEEEVLVILGIEL